jgi:hypothetical protein
VSPPHSTFVVVITSFIRHLYDIFGVDFEKAGKILCYVIQNEETFACVREIEFVGNTYGEDEGDNVIPHM